MANILIVDDDETERLALVSILEQAGHDVRSARDGDEALQLYVEERVHVVVTDIVMPGRDGLSLISALKSLDPSSAIIAVSGKSQSQLEASKLFGAREILTKPVDAEELVAAVEDAVNAGS